MDHLIWLCRYTACLGLIVGILQIEAGPQSRQVFFAPALIPAVGPMEYTKGSYRAQESLNSVWAKLCQKVDCETISIRVHDSPQINAQATAEVITITTALLSVIQSNSELAFVLAHELAHIKEGHATALPQALLLTDSQLARVNTIRRQWEFDADALAISLLREASFKMNSVRGLLTRLYSHRKPLPGEHHPRLRERLDALG